MLRYYIDHNFHADIVRGLRRRNIDCLTAAEDGYRRAKDPALLSRASELARWSVQIGRSIEDLELVAHAMSPAEIRNTVIRLPF